jgi:agmatine deiminase
VDRLTQTPRALGYRMPAEWERHEATWLAWPHERTDWPDKFAIIPWVYGEIVRQLAAVEKVRILVQDEAEERRARAVLRAAHADTESVSFVQQATDRSWIRDYGPIFVRDRKGNVAVTKWRFNAWAKYDNWKRDDAAAKEIARREEWRLFEPGLVLEGGSIDVNGQGALLTTEECLLSAVQARNPGVGRKEIERALAENLGATRVLWLRRGIAGDDTHGHIDDIARFVSADTVAAAVETDKADENYEPLRENLELLRAMKLQVAPIPMPRPLYFKGQRLPASYLNFYIANELVLVPTFHDPNDRVALNRLARVFPDRKVVGIHCVDLVLGLGTLHCMTQQQPSGDG